MRNDRPLSLKEVLTFLRWATMAAFVLVVAIPVLIPETTPPSVATFDRRFPPPPTPSTWYQSTPVAKTVKNQEIDSYHIIVSAAFGGLALLTYVVEQGYVEKKQK